MSRSTAVVGALPEAATILAIIADPAGMAAPGCAVGVFRPGAAEYSFAGAADIEACRPPDADTLFYAGSLGKQFTALAVVQLVIAGKVRFEEDIRTFLPEMRPRGRPITVAMLLHHIAGVPNTAKLLPLAGYARAADTTFVDTLRMLTDYPDTAFPPGTTFEYSNGGYLLLAAMVERVAGETFADYVRSHILLPIGMTRSCVLRGDLPDDPNRARGYMPADGAFTASEDLPLYGGAGGMMLTLGDLARYHHDIIAGQVVWTSEVVRLMTQPGVYADGSPVILPVPSHIFGYAAGLMLSRDWILHGGNYAGFQAAFAWYPGTGDGIAVLCNRGDANPMQLAARILSAVAPDLPHLDAPRFTLAEPQGRFVSDTLAAVYDIVLAGDDLVVTITPPGNAPSVTWTYDRSGEGAYARGPTTLVFDPDHRGFRVINESVSERFRRSA